MIPHVEQIERLPKQDSSHQFYELALICPGSLINVRRSRFEAASINFWVGVFSENLWNP